MRNPFHAGPSTSLTIVIKLGTSSIIHPETHQPLLSLLSSVVETICALRAQGHRVVLVSSGAIGVGMKRMGVRERGKGLAGKQVRSSVCSSALPPRDVVRRLAPLSEADSVHRPARPGRLSRQSVKVALSLSGITSSPSCRNLSPRSS